MGSSFDALPETERVARLEALARTALRSYDLDVRRVTLLSASWNCVFGLETPDGPLVLRVTRPLAQASVAKVASEAMFLAALADGTDLMVPRPVANRDGGFVTVAAADGVPEPRSCVVFTWVPGDELAHDIRPGTWAALGALHADLHTFTAGWTPPPDFQVISYDRVFHYTPCSLFGEGVDLGPHTGLLRDAITTTDTRIAAHRARHPAVVVHGDLHQWNVKLHEGVACPIDFEDTLWATPLLDVVTSLYYVRFRDDWPALFDAFREGYAARRPWVEEADGEVERLLVSRALCLLNVVHQMGEASDATRARLLERTVTLARSALR